MVTEGEPLTMILYYLGLIPIILALKHNMEDSEAQKSQNALCVCYFDDSVLASTCARIKAWFEEIIRIGTSIYYHHELAQSFFVPY